ncbi:MAG: helix-turn-helix transcriptional regulator [Planctomycetia bacterium]|nr:helix-turn-helix transcriptional regulator [Planctomycetia bacterium]
MRGLRLRRSRGRRLGLGAVRKEVRKASFSAISCPVFRAKCDRGVGESLLRPEQGIERPIHNPNRQLRAQKTGTRRSARRGRADGPTVEPTNPGEGILTPKQWAEVARRFGLTPRELQVAVLTVEDLKLSAIARRLRVKPRTVRFHLQSAYRKLGVHDRTMLVRTILRLAE